MDTPVSHAVDADPGRTSATEQIAKIDAAVAQLADLALSSVDTHAARFKAAHRSLQDALADVAPAGATAQPPQPQPPPPPQPPKSQPPAHGAGGSDDGPP